MSPSYPTITCETVRREDTSFKTHIHHHHTWHWVLSTRHISSRFIPYFSSCSLRHTIRTLSLTCIKHHSIGFSTSTSAIVSPDGGLQVCWDAAITPAPAQHKCSVVVEHGVGAAPDHHWPLVVLADPHPFPVLNLRYDRSLGLRIVVSQDPGTGPVHIGRSHKHFLTQKYLQWLTKIISYRALAATPGTVGGVVDPGVVLQLYEPGVGAGIPVIRSTPLSVLVSLEHQSSVFTKALNVQVL